MQNSERVELRRNTGLKFNRGGAPIVLLFFGERGVVLAGYCFYGCNMSGDGLMFRLLVVVVFGAVGKEA